MGDGKVAGKVWELGEEKGSLDATHYSLMLSTTNAPLVYQSVTFSPFGFFMLQSDDINTSDGVGDRIINLEDLQKMR